MRWLKEKAMEWYYNVWRERRLLKNKEYLYYYCNLWCFVTNQWGCRK